MKILLILFLSISSYSMSQHLTYKEKKTIRRELKAMLKSDQQYRIELTNQQNQSLKDSLWKLQSQNDSINKEKFKQIILNSGYPSLTRVGTELSTVLILHFTNQNDFIELDELFLSEIKTGNMPKMEYARWYDRCQINMGKLSRFGAYGNEKLCGDRLTEINKNRLDFGLDAIVSSGCN